MVFDGSDASVEISSQQWCCSFSAHICQPKVQNFKNLFYILCVSPGRWEITCKNGDAFQYIFQILKTNAATDSMENNIWNIGSQTPRQTKADGNKHDEIERGDTIAAHHWPCNRTMSGSWHILFLTRLHDPPPWWSCWRFGFICRDHNLFTFIVHWMGTAQFIVANRKGFLCRYNHVGKFGNMVASLRNCLEVMIRGYVSILISHFITSHPGISTNISGACIMFGTLPLTQAELTQLPALRRNMLRSIVGLVRMHDECWRGTMSRMKQRVEWQH